jgi:hypothetical protein
VPIVKPAGIRFLLLASREEDFTTNGEMKKSRRKKEF